MSSSSGGRLPAEPERLTDRSGVRQRAEAVGVEEISSPQATEVTHRAVQQTDAACADAVQPLGRRAIPSVVARAIRGEASALDSIVRAELPRVERLLRRMLGPRDDLDDLVQTVFLELCRALPGFRGDSALSTFVGGITVRVARRTLRPTAWARLTRPMEDEASEGVSADRPESNAIATERVRRLDRALAKLTPPKRMAFVLWAVDGADVASIAEAMDASVSATRSRIYYAQKELRALATLDPYLKELVEETNAR